MPLSRNFYGIGHSQANEEWPEFISTVNETNHQSIKTKTAQDSPKETKTIDIKKISSSDDLKRIHQRDPFMYYSIPEARQAELMLRDVDIASIGVDTLTRSAASCPSRLQTVRSMSTSSQNVTRKTRISFESDPLTLLMEELMEDEDESDDEGELLGHVQRIELQTAKEDTPIEAESISSLDELKSIRTLDPFMYYSFPEVRRAEMLLEDIDIATLVDTMSSAESSSWSQVTRKSRISCECDALSLLTEDDEVEDVYEGESFDPIALLMEDMNLNEENGHVDC